MASTVAGILLFGVHASRPSSGVSVGTLYACSTHGLVYQTTDTGATWVTWATLGGTPPVAGSPTVVLGTAAATGAAATFVATDATIVAFDATNPAATVPGDAAVVGVVAKAARRDHVHPRLSDTFDVAFIIDGGGSAITTGIKGDLSLDFAATINQVTLLADQSGSIVIDIWKDTYANYPPTVADTITASAKPTITTATKSKDSTLTGWTTSVASGDTLRFNVDSITTCTRVVVVLKMTRA